MEKKHKIIIAVAAVVGILILAIPAMMIFGVVIWQLGVFSISSEMNSCSGFNKIRCIDSQYDSSSNKLSAVFVNGVGNIVEITDVKVSGDCTAGSFEKVEVNAGQSTQFSCTGTKKRMGEPFSVNVEITYTEKVAGMAITRTESGGITGTVE